MLTFFCAKVFFEAFFYLKFGFVIFWQKNISAKAAHKMLMKWTIRVNFINVLLETFLFESVFRSFSIVTV